MSTTVDKHQDVSTSHLSCLFSYARYEVVDMTARMLRKDRPIHLLGIGGVRDIFHGVRQGMYILCMYILCASVIDCGDGRD